MFVDLLIFECFCPNSLYLCLVSDLVLICLILYLCMFLLSLSTWSLFCLCFSQCDSVWFRLPVCRWPVGFLSGLLHRTLCCWTLPLLVCVGELLSTFVFLQFTCFHPAFFSTMLLLGLNLPLHLITIWQFASRFKLLVICPRQMQTSWLNWSLA